MDLALPPQHHNLRSGAESPPRLIVGAMERERLAARAQLLRERMSVDAAGAGAGAWSAGRAVAGAASPLAGPAAAAAMELIHASDPLHDVYSAACAADRAESSAAQREVQRRQRESAGAAPPLLDDAMLWTACRLQVSVGEVEMTPGWQPAVLARETLALRYSVPMCSPVGRRGEDVVQALCRERDGRGSVLSFRHASSHELTLTASTLPDITSQPVILELLVLEAPDVEQATGSPADGRHEGPNALVIGVASVPWHEVLLARSRVFRTSAELLQPGCAEDSPMRLVGRAEVTISLHPGIDEETAFAFAPAAAEPSSTRDVHLRVQLGRVCLQTATLEGFRAVLKLSPAQEISSQAVGLKWSGRNVVEGHFDCSVLAHEPVWQVTGHRGDILAGPTPRRLFIQFWRGCELLALARVPLEGLLGREAVLELLGAAGAAGRRQVELLVEDVEVRCGSTGAQLGTVQVALHAAAVARGESPQSLFGAADAPASLPAMAPQLPGKFEPQVTERDWYRKVSSALLRLAASDVKAESIIVSAGGDPASNTSKISRDALQQALVQRIAGINHTEAAALVAAMWQSLCEVPAGYSASRSSDAAHDCLVVHAHVACQYLRGRKARVESCVETLVQDVGPACDAIACDLSARALSAFLTVSDLASLLAALDVHANVLTLTRLSESLGALADAPSLEIPANLLAELLLRRRTVAAAARTSDHAQGEEVGSLRQEVAAMLRRVHTPDGTLRHLQRYARADGTIDRFALAAALEDALREDIQQGSLQLVGRGRDWAEAAASIFIRGLSGGQEIGLLVDTLTSWLLDASWPHGHTAETIQMGSRLRPPPLNSQVAWHEATPSQHFPAQRATMRLFLPLSQECANADFGSLFEDCATRALEISPGRVRVLRAAVGSRDIEFEIAPGMPGELSPGGALHALSVQLANSQSPLRSCPAGPYLAQAELFDGDEPFQPSGAAASETGVLAASEQLLGMLAAELGSHEVQVAQIVVVLDTAAQKISRHSPEIWCTPSSPRQVSRSSIYVAADPVGAAVVIAAWHSLGYGVSAPIAVAALLRLTRLVTPGILRVVEDDVRMVLLMHEHSPRLARSPRYQAGACVSPRWMNRTSPRNEAGAGLSHLKKYIFKVVYASGVDPSVAFALVDQDRDGLVSAGDCFLTLQALDMPLPDVHLGSLALETPMDNSSFLHLYAAWLEGGQVDMPAASAAGVARESPLLQHDCLALPSFLVYAMLEEGKCTPSVMRYFLEHCTGLPPSVALKGVAESDLGSGGVVSYREFRKHVGRLDQEVAELATQEQRMALGELRAAVRALLELVEHPPDSADESKAVAIVEGTLRRRGRTLDTTCDAFGVTELLEDLRLSPVVAAPLMRAWAAASAALAGGAEAEAHRAQRGAGGAAAMPTRRTYASVLNLLRRALALLRGHLDALFAACMCQEADLRALLAFALPRPEAAVTVAELETALHSAGVCLDAVDVLRVLDPHHRDVVSARELIEGYEAFRARQGALLGAIACRLSGRGLSPDELFARAAAPRAGIFAS